MTLLQVDQHSDGRVAGSFRDPAGYVFRRAGRVYRAVDDECRRVLRDLADDGTLDGLIADGLLVPTGFVEVPQLVEALRAEHCEHDHFLEHETVAPITYPSEWSISMLADAGVHTIELQLRLLDAGCSLKDASAYNVQFRGARPVFIDLGSIEHPPHVDVWTALAQFHRMFTFPLLLCRHHGWDPRSYFLAEPGGRNLDQMTRAFGPLERWRGRLLLDVTLPHLLERRASRRAPTTKASAPKNARDAAQRWNLSRLRKKLRRLADGYRPRGAWTRYADKCHYAAGDQAAKQQAVFDLLNRRRPHSVIDLGCNTGDFSLLAARAGARVTSIDNNHDAVEVLYRRLKQSPAAVTPIVADVTSPTPGVGFRNREWSPLVDRLEADCVLALALVHHLLVTGNLTIAAVRDLLFDLSGRDLVIEYISPADPMFQTLLGARRERYEWLTPEVFRRVFCERFCLHEEMPLGESGRSLMMFEKAV